MLLGEVEWVIVGGDAVSSPLWTRRQARSQQAVVHHVDKRHHGMPAFVIIPHLSMIEKDNYSIGNVCTLN